MTKLRNIYGETIIEGPEDANMLFVRAYNEGLSLKAVDAENIRIVGIKFNGLDVSMGKLRNSNFDDCIFENSNFSQTDLQSCSTVNTKFISCNLSRSVFINAHAKQLMISSCIVEKMQCRGANLSGSSWVDNKMMSDLDYSFCNLDKVNFDSKQRMSVVDFGHLASCKGAQLPGFIEYADFTNSALLQANLDDTILVKSTFDYTNVIDSKCARLTILEGRSTNMKIINSNLNDCILFGDHVRMEVSDTTLQRAKLSGDFKLSQWSNVDMLLAMGIGSDLQNSKFSKVSFNQANFSSSGLQLTQFIDSPLSEGTFNNSRVYKTEFSNSPKSEKDTFITAAPITKTEEVLTSGIGSERPLRFVSDPAPENISLSDKLINTIHI
jgi:uncharacterized protein YjbI with pentapeptide repeats